MSARKLAPALGRLVEQHSLATVLDTLTGLCSDRVTELLSPRAHDPEAARPWSRVACKLEELAIYASENEL